MNNEIDPKGHLIEHLRDHAVRTDGPFTLRSGEVSDWDIDARHTTFDGWGAILVGEAVLAAVDPDVTAVGGMTLGADPIAVATAMSAARARRPLQSFSIRKESKGHGTGGRLVGPVVAGDVVAVSVTNLQGVYLDPEDRDLMKRLRGLEPVGRAGRSILIFRPDFAWPPPAAQTTQ